MDWKEELKFGTGAKLLLSITKDFLVQYFEHSSSDAEKMIIKFFRKYDYIDEDFIHHEMSWSIATAVHFSMHLNGERGDLREWEKQNGYLDPPDNAVAYMKKHYWDKVVGS